MKNFIKRHYIKITLIAFDVLILPCILLCKLITDLMLKSNDVCIWTRFGGQCVTCGGTHFVNDLGAGRIAAAFMDNQLLFVLAVYSLLTLIVLNLYFVFGVKWCKKLLRVMYSIPVGIIFSVGFVVFMVWRNIPLMINMARIAKFLLSLLPFWQ